MRPRLLTAMIAILAAVAVEGCQSLKDLSTVYAALDKHFHEPMSLKINNGSHLVITLVNAPESALDDAGREGYAREVAAFAKSQWPHPGQLDDITVAFSSVSKTGVVTFTNTSGTYSWRLDELQALAPSDSTPPPVPASGTATRKKD